MQECTQSTCEALRRASERHAGVRVMRDRFFDKVFDKWEWRNSQVSRDIVMAWEAIEYFTYLADLVYCSLLSIWYWYPLPYY